MEAAGCLYLVVRGNGEATEHLVYLQPPQLLRISHFLDIELTAAVDPVLK